MIAPTEAEIRAAIADGITRRPREVDEITDVAFRVSGTIRHSPYALTRRRWAEDFYPDEVDELTGTLWADLTEAETAAIEELVDNAARRFQERAAAILLEELVLAGVAFAEAHPDVPRGTWQREAVPA